MLSGLRFWLSPRRRRFMRRIAAPALSRFRRRVAEVASPSAEAFVSILLEANADFLAYSFSPDGPLAEFADASNPESVESCLAALLIYSVALFAREDFQT